MPRAKKTSAPKTVETKEATPEKNRRIGKYLFFGALAIIALFLISKNKNLLIVATVDGQPIWRPAFEQQIVNKVGQETLDSMIDEKIMSNEAKKRNITVSPEEVTVKITQIEKTLPAGTTLEQALASQKMTMAEFKSRVAFQITIEKLVNSMPKISQKEIDDYIVKNKEFLTSTDAAQLKEEATQAINNQKLQTLFADLKKKAKISKFL